MRRTQHPFCAIPTKDKHPKSNHKETSDKPKLSNILHNNHPVIFKNVRIKKGKNEEVFF